MAYATILTLDGTSLASVNGTFNNFNDMYRYFRLKWLHIDIIQQDSTASEQAFIMTHVAPGLTTPVLMTSVENMATSKPFRAVGFSAGSHQMGRLTLDWSQFRQVSEGGWLVTNADSAATELDSYGLVQMLASSTVTPAIAFTVQLRFVAEFKELVDPITITQRILNSAELKAAESTEEISQNPKRVLYLP